MSPSKTSEVCGALLDLDADQAFLNQLIISVRSLLHVEPLVAEFEKRYKLKLLSPFLEHLGEGGWWGDRDETVISGGVRRWVGRWD